MHITATQIAAWAATRPAQDQLPWLIRKLLHAADAELTEIDFPAGDSISRPGWDGRATADSGTTWLPAGRSRWEVSCEGATAGAVTSKANRVYNQRLQETATEERALTTYVFVTARKWSTKRKWPKSKTNDGWRAVEAYDADDLEQWLETEPAVALWFAELIGMQGPGMESVERLWKRWAEQSRPAITAAALFADREQSRDRLLETVRAQMGAGNSMPVSVVADSAAEAVAFAAVAILTDPALEASTIVVTDVDGWRFVDRNPDVSLVLAETPAVAERLPSAAAPYVTVVPSATGDYSDRRAEDEAKAIRVPRPRPDVFEKALRSLGIDYGDAERLARNTGRSWSVWRRERAVNRAIRRPLWLGAGEAWVLPVVCLFSAWSEASKADCDAIATVARRDYEDVERALRSLASLDDAPVVSIRRIWHAKSPLELIDLLRDRITTGERTRFFGVVRDALLAPDPVLELSAEERPFAQLREKVRPQSPYLLKGMSTALVRLAVFGDRDMVGRVRLLVRDLLHGADSERWLSLASFLPALAEAGPTEFLNAVQDSLDQPEPPVACLFSETTESGSVFGQCWHADLLWALELLAWSPEYVTQVALLLARLSDVAVRGNWGNSAFGSLFGIFRARIPQTAATLDERIAALDTLMDRVPQVAFEVFLRLSNTGPGSALLANRPAIRGFDTGAGYGTSIEESWAMVGAAAERLLDAAAGDSCRLGQVLSRMDSFSGDQQAAAIEHLDAFAQSQATDEEKETVRGAIRSRLHDLRDGYGPEAVDTGQEVSSLERLYESLVPGDLIVRHRWLFAEWSPCFSFGWSRRDRDRYRDELARLRREALQEVWDASGPDGLTRLAVACAGRPLVGLTLGELDLEVEVLTDWVVGAIGDCAEDEPVSATVRGLLARLEWEQAERIVRSVLAVAERPAWETDRQARFLLLAPAGAALWGFVEGLAAPVREAYWSLFPDSWLGPECGDVAYPVQQLLASGRPRAALAVISLRLDEVSPELLTTILEGIAAGKEAVAPLESSTLRDAIEILEKAEEIDRARLATLEFPLLPALGYLGEQVTTTLVATMTSDPVLFADLVCRAFPRRSAEGSPLSEAESSVAMVAYSLLRECRRLPGTLDDGTIDLDTLDGFVDSCRSRCEEVGLLERCDESLGIILAWAPRDADGGWPCRAVSNLLDRSGMEEVRRGFVRGVRERRGVTTRSPWEGGDQERELARRYREYACACRSTHLRVAAALDEIADEYEREGRWEDHEAQLRREGY